MLKKPAFIISGIIILICVIAAVAIFTSAGSVAVRVNKELDLGHKYLLEGNYKEAIVAFEKVIRIDPKNIEVRMTLAEVHIQIWELDNAEKRVREVLEIDDTYTDAYIKLADILILQGDLESAIGLLEKAFTRLNAEEICDKLDKIRPLAPVASIQSGAYDAPFSLELISDLKDWIIRYTLDGSIPNENSPVYSAPIHIQEGKTIINAACFSKNAKTTHLANYEYEVKFPVQTGLFQDQAFELLIKKLLNKENSPLLTSELENITRLTIWGNRIFEETEQSPISSYSREHFWISEEMIEEKGNIRRLDDLKFFPNLKYLTVTHQSNLDISALSKTDSIPCLKNISNLTLVSNGIKSISALEGLASVTELELIYNEISDITSISKLENLRSLYLNDNKDITSQEPIKDLHNLKSIGLFGVRSVDINILIGLSNLIRISLAVDDNMDYSLLKELTSIRHMEVSCEQENLQHISNMTFLSSLRLHGNGLNSIDPIASMTNLESLDLLTPNCNNIDALKKLTNLKSLEIDVSNDCSLEPLKSLPNLESVYSNNQETEKKIRELLPNTKGPEY